MRGLAGLQTRTRAIPRSCGNLLICESLERGYRGAAHGGIRACPKGSRAGRGKSETDPRGFPVAGLLLELVRAIMRIRAKVYEMEFSGTKKHLPESNPFKSRFLFVQIYQIRVAQF